MECKIDILRNGQYKTSNWSGGTTTELMIYPKEAEYSERNFKWRISSAKVEAEESIFTNLPGYERILMVIDGELSLEHEGHHKAFLSQFHQDKFKGEWVTKSVGKVVDFNLMMTKECVGSMEVLVIKEQNFNTIINEFHGEHQQSTENFYIVEGLIEVSIKEKKFSLHSGDMFTVTQSSKKEKVHIRLLNIGEDEAKVIRTIVFY